MKRKIGWIAVIAAVLAAAFILGVTGTVSLAKGDGKTNARRVRYRANTMSEDAWYLVLDNVEYGNDECSAALSGTLALRGTGEAEMVPVEVPEQRVTFREMMNDEWYAWITVGDGERIALHARRQKTASADGKATYGEIVCLWTENVDVTYWYAGEEGGEWEKEDRLVGCLITFAPLWDCLEEGALVADGGFGGRVNAELRSFSEVDEDGELREWKEYVFPGVRGLRLFECHINDAGFIYRSTMVDGPLFGVRTGIDISDLGDKVTMEGTLLFLPCDRVLYMNPVYQKEDGRVYADAGNGIGTLNMSSGITGSNRLDQTDERKVNGETVRAYACEVTLHFGPADLPVRYTVVEMDGEHRLCASHTYSEGEIPETLAILPETAYVVLEKEYAEDGGPTLTREIVERKDGGISLMLPMDDVLCAPVWIPFMDGE